MRWTVVEFAEDWFSCDVSGETLSCTTLGDWKSGSAVNLERSLKVGEELGGHLVLGHVDGVARIVKRQADGGSIRFSFVVSLVSRAPLLTKVNITQGL